MSTPATVKAQLRFLLNNANEVTNANDTTLTESNETLIAGYGKGDCGGDNTGGSAIINLQEKTFTENGTYKPDSGFQGFSKVVVNVKQEGGQVSGFSNEIARLYNKGDYTPFYQSGCGESGIYMMTSIMGEGTAGFYTKIET